MNQETVVATVGAGPSGVATAACLNLLSIPNIVLEREDCCASLWKKRSYERLKLHIPKQYCHLPNMPFPSDEPTFVSRTGFIQYLDNYVSHFNVNSLYCRSVKSASYSEIDGKWRLVAENLVSNETEVYASEFLVVATGENGEGFVPEVLGLDGFEGEVIHSSKYENGRRFGRKDVLVVGTGNSGMEIAYDLSNWGAKPYISVRSPVHVISKEMGQLGLFLLKFLPCDTVDKIIVMLSKFKYGDFFDYGLERPSKGPFRLKQVSGRSPVIDVGTMDKIKTGEIQILPSLNSIVDGDTIEFANGKTKPFEAIIFATGYRSTVMKWLKDDGEHFNKEGMPKQRGPNHWKGKNGLYCVGFARAGLFGISKDAQNIAQDISFNLQQNKMWPPLMNALKGQPLIESKSCSCIN